MTEEEIKLQQACEDIVGEELHSLTDFISVRLEDVIRNAQKEAIYDYLLGQGYFNKIRETDKTLKSTPNIRIADEAYCWWLENYNR